MPPPLPPPEPPPAPERPGRAVRLADAVSDGAGHLVRWLVGAMILIGVFNALARYLSRWTGTNLSSNAYIELQWYLFSLVFLLGASYALRHDAHVRVDVLYGRLSTRGRAWVDTLGTVLFLLPFSVFMLVVSWPSVAASWRVREISPDPGGLPRYPLRAVVLVAFALLVIQGIAETAKRVGVLRGARPAPGLPADPDPREGV